jgi:hypothetical protein
MENKTKINLSAQNYFQKSIKGSIVNLVIKILSLPGCLLDKDLKTAGIELLKSLLVSPREAEITKRNPCSFSSVAKARG